MNWPEAFTFLGSIESLRLVWVVHAFYAVGIFYLCVTHSLVVWLLWQIWRILRRP